MPVLLLMQWTLRNFFYHSFHLVSWLPSYSLNRLVVQLMFNPNFPTAFLVLNYLTIFPKMWCCCLQQFYFLSRASLVLLFLHIFSSVLLGEENKHDKDGKAGQQKVPTKSSVTIGPRGPGNSTSPCLTLLILFFTHHSGSRFRLTATSWPFHFKLTCTSCTDREIKP